MGVYTCEGLEKDTVLLTSLHHKGNVNLALLNTHSGGEGERGRRETHCLLVLESLLQSLQVVSWSHSLSQLIRKNQTNQWDKLV